MRFVSLILMTLIFQAALSQKYYLLMGTYTRPKESKGIYIYQFDAKTGDAKLAGTCFTDNPSYIALNTKGDRLYAVNELGDGRGAVSSFSFDKKNGALHFINSELTRGEDPCYLAIDANNKWIVTANYSGGSFSVLPIKEDGSVGKAVQVIQHEGSGINKKRQEKAHVHSTVFTLDKHFLAVADLGMDKITIYPFDATKQKPVTDQPVEINTAPGSGPRHIVFDPRKPFAYVVEELSGNLVAYRYHAGKLDSLQTVSSHPTGFHGDKGSAAIHFSPDGKFLYASNRGESNTISIFSVSASTGKLSSLGFQATGGDHPRDFTIDPSGNFLLAANMKSDNIVLFRRNARTGLLLDSGKKIAVPQPTRLLFTSIR